MDLVTNSKAVPSIPFFLNSSLSHLRSFGIRAKSGNLVKHAEVLLVVETARLFTWAHAMGIVHTDNRPKLVPELATSDSQKPITEVLKALNALVSDDYLIGKAYGCRPWQIGEKTSITLIKTPEVTSAATALARTFNCFENTISPFISKDHLMWVVTDGDKFEMFVAEVRLLVSRLHRVTAEIVPCSALDAMFYTRISRITEQWVAQTLADACEFKDEYCEIESLASDRASIYDIKSYDALHLVEEFIGRVPFTCQCTRLVYGKMCSKMFSIKDDTKGDSRTEEKHNDQDANLEKYVRELKARLMSLEEVVWDAVAVTRAVPPMPGSQAFNSGRPSRHHPPNAGVRDPNTGVEVNSPANPANTRTATIHGINLMPKAAADPPWPSPCNVKRSSPSRTELMPPPPPPQAKWTNPCVPAITPHVNRLSPQPETYTPSTGSAAGSEDDDGSFKDHHGKRDREQWVDVPSDSELSGSEILDMAPPCGAKGPGNASGEPGGVEKEPRIRNICIPAGQANGPTGGKQRHVSGAKSMAASAGMLT